MAGIQFLFAEVPKPFSEWTLVALAINQGG